MEDWERDDFVPPKPAVNNDRWEGEDEDDDVKDNWDDDDDEKKEDEGEEQESQIVAVQPKKKRPLAQIIAEKEKKRQEELEEKRKQGESESKVLSQEEALEEKLMRQKLQEESDLELAKETFGVNDSIKTDDMTPKSKEDFDEFRKALVSKISKFEGSPYYLLFIEELCRDLVLPLQPDDIKKITVTLNAISTEKIRAQKVAKGKKKGKTKTSLNFERANLVINDYGDDYGDDFEDYM